MSTPLLTTKLYIPAPRPSVVGRPHLIARLNAGRHRKLTLISAAAGFGKTTLVSEWIADPSRTSFRLPIVDFGLKGQSIHNPQSKIQNRHNPQSTIN
jgi:hypothetical protein